MNRLKHLMSPRRMPLVLAVACILAVAAAMVMQQVFDYRPCPWCILQRMIFLSIALLCIVTAMTPSRRLRIGLNALTLLLAVLGISAAVYQHEVAAKMYSCNLTFADKVISALGIESLWPALFQVTATCAEAAVKILGVPFEYWSLTLFALVTLASATLMLRAVRVEAA
jgi:protein dithiol:quinone oxidoreductase